ncbi:ABC transporter substrate-binding protein [Acidithiobacillus thiooxidans]|uniref:ABC transporter substrate-binding protein n=1 Tax=Acidithiobacillus thiooxidans TaxID=930 RepID=UPI001C07AF9D|nr:ABC transporter substrate-binding protein [Acidithiobacillus thiooxidans]MBU2749947.1 ABC transporter substrate-binding protein [Acidithiobacillus thiooxidans]
MNRKMMLRNAFIGISLVGFMSSNANAGDTNISLYLKWVPQYQFAGYLVAKANGYYKKKGLNVKIISGGPDINTVQEVADGAAQFGIQTPEPIFYAYEHGLKLKMLMADFQKPYEEFMVKKTSSIKSIEDFKGKTIGINIGGLSQLLLPYILEKNGVKPNEVRTVRKTLSLAPFLSGRVPIWNGYVGNEPFESMDAGVPVREFKLAKYAPNWYGDTLFSTSSYIKNHPNIVKKFVEASQKGWLFSIKHPQKTINIILKDNPQKTRKQLEQEASAVIPLFTSKMVGQDCFGRISNKRVYSMEKAMIKFGGWKESKIPSPNIFYANNFLRCNK